MFDSFKKKKGRCNITICKKNLVHTAMIIISDCMWSIYIFFLCQCNLLFSVCFSIESSHNTAWLPVHEWLELWQSACTLSLLLGVLGVFCGGRKWTILLHLQSPAGYRLLPWLHLTLPPDFWNGRKCGSWSWVVSFVWRPQRKKSWWSWKRWCI